MGLQSYIGGQTVRSQLRNGSDFTINTPDAVNFFQANVGEKVQVFTSFFYRWFSEATQFNKISVHNQLYHLWFFLER